MQKLWTTIGGVGVAAALMATATLTNTSAFAQQRTDVGTTASPLTQSPTPALPLPNAGTGQGYFFNLRPVGEKIGKSLADYGIYVTGRTFNEEFSNVSGGLKRGSLYEGFTTLGFDLDMNRIAGIQGGSVHFLANDLNGLPFLPYSGSNYANNKVFSGPAASRLNELSYEQSFFDHRFDVRVGRVPTGTEFDTTDLYCEFVFSLCAAPSAFNGVRGYPSYLTSSWGLVTQTQLPKNFFFNIAAYEDEPSLATTGHYNWPGPDWGFDRARGVTIPAQFGYRTSYKNDPYPTTIDIGALYDTGDYSDPLQNSSNRNRGLFGGTAKVDHGKSEMWMQAQKVVYRPDMTSERGITLFVDANLITTGNPIIDDAFYGGFVWRGPFAERPNDKFNVSVGYILLNSDYTNFVNSALQKRGFGATSHGAETTVEVNYGLALAPGVTFKPFLDYIVNPDQVNVAVPSPNNTHVLFVGAAISVFFPETLGLPKLGF
ncbi:carbohydrate porin [Beijerinckia sp. L45]|uniref:carbohydrate porin n=1 Tax=Beijerinckia sp. L45 TaxID=1641855 RepID=UPI001AED1AE1|nr:carbohydrate porin [Beijerinckia sp. L45]